MAGPHPDDKGFRPSRPDPVRGSGKPEAGAPIVMAVAAVVAMVVFCGAILYLFLQGHHEDRRIVRRYGNLECVYNVDRDRVESCVSAGG